MLEAAPTSQRPLTRLGRYTVHEAIASGGMATVYLGRLVGPGGFGRTVAIKRLHPHLADDPEFVSMLLDEARLAGRIQHPNVIATLDVVSLEHEFFVVMEYVHGQSLSDLLRELNREDSRTPPEIAAAIMNAALHGLHAAHESTGERGEPLHLVHRDVSPQNILVGVDGITRVLDFGVAKAKDRINTTTDGRVKGKLAYMALEQLRAAPIDRRVDIYGAGVVLWELLTGRRLFAGSNDAETITNVMTRHVDPPSSVAAGVPKELDDVVMRALSRDAAGRFDTARQMALALEQAVSLAGVAKIGEWVEATASSNLRQRALIVQRIEASTESSRIETIAPEGEADSTPTRQSSSVWLSESLETPDEQASRKRRRMIALLAAAAGGVALLGLSVKACGETASTTKLATGVEQPASVSVAATPVESPPDTPSPPTSAAAPAPSVSAAAGPLPTTRQSRPARAAPASKTIPARNARAKCDPPYVIDSAGVRHYKPECPLE